MTGAPAPDAVSMLAAALAYAARGLPVFPCDPASKRPLTPNGFKNATIDQATISLWWNTWLRAMIGVPTGKVSNCFVLDVDFDAKKAVDGAVALAALTERNGVLPPTATQVTPRGGRHYFFLHPGTKVINSAGKLGPGLDIRGDGGYVIVAPSTNASGAQYRWEGGVDDRVAAPDWLLRLVSKSPTARKQKSSRRRDAAGQAKIEAEATKVSTAPKGQRNDALNRAAYNLGRIVGRSEVSRESAESALFDAARNCGLVDDDGADSVAATIRSGLESGLAAAKCGLGEGEGKLSGRLLELADPVPWPEPVGGAALLDGIASLIRRHVVLDERLAIAIALWVVHTYCFDAFHITPRLLIRSPVRGCGKTTLLDLIAELGARARRTSSITGPALFRAIEKFKPTLLIDEADTFLGNDDGLRGVLNDGYRRGGEVIRLVGDSHEPRVFSTHAPVAIAGLGTIHDTLASRSIIIELRRKLPSETTESFRADRVQEFKILARRCVRWCADNLRQLQEADPIVPPRLFNREADNWRGLLAIADAAGGTWPARARAAASALTPKGDDEQSTGIRLLADIKSIFEAHSTDRLASAELCSDLAKIEGAPWAEMKNGKPISPNQLARRLKPFHIVPGTIRIQRDTPKGYYRAQFDEAWSRYLPSEPPQRHNAISSGTSEHMRNATRDEVWRIESATRSNGNGHCGGVADSEPLPDDDAEERAAIIEFDERPSTAEAEPPVGDVPQRPPGNGGAR